VQQHAEAPEIGPRIDRLTERLLGRHVRQRADRSARSGVGQRRPIDVVAVGEQLGDTEVQYLHVPFRRQHHVRRLQISMHDATLVRLGERVGDLDADRRRLAGGERRSGEPRGERFPGHALHDEIRQAVDLEHVEQCGDSGMRQARERERLPAEAHPARLVAEGLRRQRLDRHVALQSRVARAIHDAHPAGTEPLHHLVGSEPGSHSENHVMLRARSVFADRRSIMHPVHAKVQRVSRHPLSGYV
jgi:hypothetical protein